jgi:hypothetical protein
LIGSFVFDDDSGQITIDDFAIPSAGWCMDHSGVDERMFSIVVHGNGDARNLKDIAIPVQGAVSRFTDTKTDFGKTHEKLPERCIITY